MARTPLLQVSDIALTFGGDPVFSDLSLVIQPGDRVALVGRNGSGKSTLLKVMAGLVEVDKGTRVAAPGVSVGYMEQDPTMEGFATLGDYASSGMDEGEAYRVEMVAEGLKFDPAGDVRTASGGERRRAALAKLMAEAPSLMLLDEPTNHLDIEAIAWLEAELKQTRNAFVLISHDRAFLRELTRATLWIDRGMVRRSEEGFDKFEDWRDKLWDEEDMQRHKLNRKIKAEARWVVEGISARRKRNQGRVRALQDLRAERASQIKRQGTAALSFESGSTSGKKVIEAFGLSKKFGDKVIIDNFDLTIQRGDRVAFVVVNDPILGKSGKADQIMVQGQPKHVVGYLKEFLFDDAQARAPVRSLSGGEKARLLLARLMARESNLLILDEPTNDLDIETLDLLQDILGEYKGTVLLVSHDRDFLDRVATTTIAMEGNGKVRGVARRDRSHHNRNW